MYKDENERMHDEDVDLTKMIHAYRQDDELHRKIEEMKKQKEQEKNKEKEKENVNPLTGESYHSSIFTQKKEETKQEEKPQSSDDKTLVIMNGNKSLSAQEEKTIVMTRNVEEETFETDAFDDEDATIVVDDGVMNFEDIPQEEDEEDEEENAEKTKKMNKAITYGILGVFVVLLLVGAFFGVRYALNSFLGSDEPKTEEPTSVKEEKPTLPAEDGDKDSDVTDIQDNSSKIASLKQQKETYEGQLKTAKSNLEKAKTAKTKTELNVNVAATNLTNIQNQIDTYSMNQILPKEKALSEKQDALKNATDIGDEALIATAKKEVEQAQADLDAAKNAPEFLSMQTQMNEASSKKQEADLADKKAQEDIDRYQKQADDLTSKIADIDKQLKELE